MKILEDLLMQQTLRWHLRKQAIYLKIFTLQCTGLLSTFLLANVLQDLTEKKKTEFL